VLGDMGLNGGDLMRF
jgi:hypothetical protein